MAVSVLCLILTVPWVGLHHAIVIFNAGHTSIHLLFTCTTDKEDMHFSSVSEAEKSTQPQSYMEDYVRGLKVHNILKEHLKIA